VAAEQQLFFVIITQICSVHLWSVWKNVWFTKMYYLKN